MKYFILNIIIYGYKEGEDESIIQQIKNNMNESDIKFKELTNNIFLIELDENSDYLRIYNYELKLFSTMRNIIFKSVCYNKNIISNMKIYLTESSGVSLF